MMEYYVQLKSYCASTECLFSWPLRLPWAFYVFSSYQHYLNPLETATMMVDIILKENPDTLRENILIELKNKFDKKVRDFGISSQIVRMFHSPHSALMESSWYVCVIDKIMECGDTPSQTSFKTILSAHPAPLTPSEERLAAAVLMAMLSDSCPTLLLLLGPLFFALLQIWVTDFLFPFSLDELDGPMEAIQLDGLRTVLEYLGDKCQVILATHKVLLDRNLFFPNPYWTMGSYSDFLPLIRFMSSLNSKHTLYRPTVFEVSHIFVFRNLFSTWLQQNLKFKWIGTLTIRGRLENWSESKLV